MRPHIKTNATFDGPTRVASNMKKGIAKVTVVVLGWNDLPLANFPFDWPIVE